MSTASKVLIVLIAVFGIVFLYVGSNVLKIQSDEKARVENLREQIKQAEIQLEEAVRSYLDTTRQIVAAEHGWGRTWPRVATALQGNIVKVELGRLDGLKEGEVLYGFAAAAEQRGAVYLGQFEVVPETLGDNAADLRVFPEYDAAAGDQVEQRNLANRIQRIQGASSTWLLRNDLPKSLRQRLMTSTRLWKEQQYRSNAAVANRDTWDQTNQSTRRQLAIREEELAMAIAALEQADDQRNVEVRARFDKHEELNRTVAAMRARIAENKALTQRIAEMEKQLETASRLKQQANAQR